MDAYLNTAEQVLFAARRPLRPREILRDAYVTGLVPWHLHGKRQDRTLHARLSEDISIKRENSRFYRTAAGIFFLRRFIADESVPEEFRSEYFARPRRKELARDAVLTVDLEELARGGALGPAPASALIEMLRSGRYTYRTYPQIAENHGCAAVHSFVVVHRRNEVLSFRTGKFFPTSDPLFGKRSIGIGGAVLATDVDMLFESLVGVVANGIAELCYAIGLPRRLAEKARYGDEVRPWLSVPHGRAGETVPVVHAVLGYACPESFVPSKAALFLNDVRWIDIRNPGNNIDDYDAASRHVLSHRRIDELTAWGS